MKHLIAFIYLLLATFAFGQTNPFETFNNQKKSISLRTGITMRYIERGNVGGTALVLLHGATDTGRSFQLLVEEMVSQNPNLRIIVPDLRGHGETSMPSRRDCAHAPEECFTPADFASDIISLLNRLDIASAYIVGHSMGSVIAQEIALAYPERVTSMVFIGTFVQGNKVLRDDLASNLLEKTWKPVLETEPDFSWPEDAYNMSTADLGGDQTAWLRKHWVNELGAPETFLDDVLRETIQIRLGTWIGTIKALSNTDNRVEVQNLTVPTLVLWASQDIYFTKYDQEMVMTAMADASRVNNTQVTYKTYGMKPLSEGMPQSDLGHNLHWAAPKQVAADIISFIRTGFPLKSQPYLNPANPAEVLEAPDAAEIRTWGGLREQASNTPR